MKVFTVQGPQWYANEAFATRAFLKSTNVISFTDEDMEAAYPNHRCSLYLEAMINDVHVRRALVDTGSSINIISLSVLIVAGVPPSQITKKETSIAGFGNGAKTLLGYV